MDDRKKGYTKLKYEIKHILSYEYVRDDYHKLLKVINGKLFSKCFFSFLQLLSNEYFTI